jgi:glycosyltransferase involved in cell wall biosynthesis
MLGQAALAYSAGQKRIFWRLAQAEAIRAVTCFHATSYAELVDIRAYGLTAPVAIIPNGIDVPDATLTQLRKKEVLYLGRIHPKKGIDRLLHAWALMCRDHPDWRLRIVGPSEEGHVEELQRLCFSLSLGDRVCFDGPAYGDEKYAAYKRASVFVLPTRNENFGMVVAEALAQGTPVISTIGAPWEGLVSERCGWWVGHGPEPMAEALQDALRRSTKELEEMGTRGRDWMQRDFGWREIAERTSELYAWCRGQADRPEFVHL